MERGRGSQKREDTGGSHEGRVAATVTGILGGGGLDAEDVVEVKAIAPADEKDADAVE